jgi:hypothetical protein
MNNSIAAKEPEPSCKGATTSIERRESAELPYDVFLRDYVVTCRPVIIVNAAREWPAVRKWTPGFFKTHFASRMVPITDGLKMPFDEFIDAAERSTPLQPGPYLHRVIIHQHLPELVADLTPDSIYGFPMRYCSPLMPKRMRRPDGYLKLLIGGVGSKFPVMHYDHDNANALITGLYGQKEFVLFSPQDTPYVYQDPNSPHTSLIADLEHPDNERFPLFAQATQYRGTVGPGEAIFVPSGWWHSTRVISMSVSVCVNMLHASNWCGFVADVCQPTYVKGWKRALKRLHLETLGAVLSAAEALRSVFPHSRVSRMFSVLAPEPQMRLISKEL